MPLSAHGEALVCFYEELFIKLGFVPYKPKLESSVRALVKLTYPTLPAQFKDASAAKAVQYGDALAFFAFIPFFAHGILPEFVKVPGGIFGQLMQLIVDQPEIKAEVNLLSSLEPLRVSQWIGTTPSAIEAFLSYAVPAQYSSAALRD